MPYINVPKPTGTPYTPIGIGGIQTFDDSTVLYDDPNVFYDGFDPNAYTNIAKPGGAGLLWQDALFAWQDANFIWGNAQGAYTDVNKPID